jgi:hypothetical protein
MAVPYHLHTDLYTRTALAEFWAFAWMPLVLYFTKRLVHQRTTASVGGLAVSYALLIGTHLFTTLMFSAVPLIYAAFLARQGERGRALRQTVLGLLLGMALSAVYLVPALAYAKYISPYKLIQSRPDYQFDRNFLFSSEISSNHFLRTLSWLTAWTAAVTAGFFGIVALSTGKSLRREGTFWAIVAAASLCMTQPASGLFWKYLPLLRAIQFPFRFNTVMTLAMTALAALAIESLDGGWEWRKMTLAVCTSLLIFGWILPIRRSMNDQKGWVAQNGSVSFDYIITSWALWTDPALLTLHGIPQIAQQGGDAKVLLDQGSATVEEWKPRMVQSHIISNADTWVTVKQFYFPTWTATLADGHPLSLQPSSPGGLIKIWVSAGENEIRLKMPYGPAEIAGTAISVMAALFVFLLIRYRSGALAHSESSHEGSQAVSPIYEPPE